jgi:ADP-heptose synthase, bifunctional sugar kinase/adenylyltransferase
MNIYHKLSTNDLKDVFSLITSKKVAVIGDFCLDAYWFINSNFIALSLETGLPVNHVEKQNYFPGGAANIVNNLKSLGVGNVDVYGVIGNDPFGNELSRQLNQINCNTKNLLIQNVNWNTHTYSKPILNENEINRMDFGVNNSLLNDTEDKLIHALKKNINDYDLVIINQQVTKGLHQNSFPTKLQAVIDANNVDFISDCRNKKVEYSNTILKTNIHEAIQKRLFIEGDSDQPIIQKKINEGFYKKIVISQEAKGCLVFFSKEKLKFPFLGMLNLKIRLEEVIVC